MFTLNFSTYLETEDPNDQTQSLGTHRVVKQMKSPYVPRVGETVEFGTEEMDRDDYERYDVIEVHLDTVSREITIYLEGFTYDQAEIDDQLGYLEEIGFKLQSYEEITLDSSDGGQ